MVLNINLLPKKTNLYLILLIITSILVILWPIIIYKQIYTIRTEKILIQKKINEIKMAPIKQNISYSSKLEKQQLYLVNIFNNLHKNINNLELNKITINNNYSNNSKITGKSESIFNITQVIKNISTAHIKKITKQQNEYSFEICI